MKSPAAPGSKLTLTMPLGAKCLLKCCLLLRAFLFRFHTHVWFPQQTHASFYSDSHLWHYGFFSPSFSFKSRIFHQCFFPPKMGMVIKWGKRAQGTNSYFIMWMFMHIGGIYRNIHTFFDNASSEWILISLRISSLTAIFKHAPDSLKYTTRLRISFIH